VRFQERDQPLALNGAVPLPFNKHKPADGLFKRHEEVSWGTIMELCHPKARLEKAANFFKHMAAAQ